MPHSPDHPHPVSTVNVTPNGSGAGDSVRYEVDNSGTLVEVRQSSTGQGTHMRFIYDVPGLANASQHRFTNLTADGTPGNAAAQNAGTGALGIAVNANGIQAVDMHVDGAQAQLPASRSRTVSSMNYREDSSSGMITPTNASPVHSRPASPMCQSPVRPVTSNINRPPVSSFGNMSIRGQDVRIQQSRPFPAHNQDQQQQQRPSGQSNDVGNQLQNLQRHESQIRINIDRLQADISSERDQVRLEESQYRNLAQRAREAREQLQEAVRSLEAVRMEQMRLENQERRRYQEFLGQIGSDDVGDLYVDDDDAAVMAEDRLAEPPLAPTRSTFQQFVTPPPSEGENNTLYAGHTPLTPYSVSPSPPAELRQAQRVRFSDRFAQGRLFTPSSPLSTVPHDSYAHLGQYEQHITTRRPLRREAALQMQSTELIDTTGVPMYAEDDEQQQQQQQRYSSEAPSEANSNFSTATTEPIDSDDQMGDIPEESMLEIDRAHAMFHQRLSTHEQMSSLDNVHESGRHTPTHTLPLRSSEINAPVDPRTSSRYPSSGPTFLSRSGNPSAQGSRAIFPRPDGSLRPQSRDPSRPNTKEERDTDVAAGLAAEEQFASSLSPFSRLSSLSSTGTAGSSAAVEQLIHVQPATPRASRAGPGPATQAQAVRNRVQTRQAPQTTPPSGVVTRSQARRQSENRSDKTPYGPYKGKGKGRD